MYILFPSPSGASILILEHPGTYRWIDRLVSISFRSINSYSTANSLKLCVNKFPSPSGASILIPLDNSGMTKVKPWSFHLLPEHQFLFIAQKMYDSDTLKVSISFRSINSYSFLCWALWWKRIHVSISFRSINSYSKITHSECLCMECFHLLPEHQFLF